MNERTCPGCKQTKPRMTRKERNDLLEQAAFACERTCGKWRVPKYNEKIKNPDAEPTCPCADAVRKLKVPQ